MPRGRGRSRCGTGGGRRGGRKRISAGGRSRGPPPHDGGLDAEAFFEFILDLAPAPVIQDGRLFASREEALETVRRGFRGIAGVKRVYDETDVTVLSPEAALLTGGGTSTVTLQDGRTLEGPFAVSLVFVLKDGAWKLLHGHYSIPNPR